MNDEPVSGGFDPNEERIARRRRVLMKGVVSFNDGFSSAPCTIRNLSDTGAMIVLDAPAAVPTRFMLHAEIAGFKVPGEVAWHRGLAMGVRFTGPFEESRIVRQQHVGTSETALSDRILHEIEIRDRRERRTDDRNLTANGQGGVSKPAFGRRITDHPTAGKI